MYSLLISCAVAIFRTSLTRFHAAIATVTAGSPLNFYLFLYSIASFFMEKHRLWGIIGQGHIFARCITIVAGMLWTALLIYVFVPAHLTHYSQLSCEIQHSVHFGNLFITPLEVYQTVASSSCARTTYSCMLSTNVQPYSTRCGTPSTDDNR